MKTHHSGGLASSTSLNRWDAPRVGMLAFALSAAGSNRPRFWNDEAATISGSTRTMGQLWKMLATIDAPHGIYYAFMHIWYKIFPVSEFSSRLPSSVAVGIAAAGVVTLGQQISTRAVALASGVVFAVLPRVTWAGSEARSYAMTMAAAVWLTIFCLTAARQGRRWRWVAYGSMLVGAVVLNMHLLLIVPAHGVAVCVFAQTPRALRSWAVTTACAIVAVAPFIVFSARRFSGGSIGPLTRSTLHELLIDQYFDRYPMLVALVGYAILFVGLVVAARSDSEFPCGLMALTISWMLCPTVVLLAISLVGDPIYVARYLTFTAPAFALLLGLSMVTIGRLFPDRLHAAVIAILLALFSLAAIPNYLAQRGPSAKPLGGMDYGPVTNVVDRYGEKGDCLVIDDSPDPNWPWPLRRILILRPEVWGKLNDYGRISTAVQENRLYDTAAPVSEWSDKMRGCSVVWAISSRDNALPDYQEGPDLQPGPRLEKTDAYHQLRQFGFGVVERWQFRYAQVAKLVR